MEIWTSPIGLVIALLVFRDMARVSPKKELYVVKAYCAYRIYGRTASAVLVYYNFITAQYEAEHMSMTSSASKKNVTAGSFVEALVTQKEDKLKLIDIVVMDEFQYLGKANKAFPSIMMGIWDRKLKDSNIMLIVCGSLINMMTTQVLSYDSPLYGRRTAQMRIGQIPFSFYHEFYPDLSEDACILRYAVTGGVPKYIELFHDNVDIYQAIRENVVSRNAFLYAEPEFLLQKEVSEIGSYFSLLKTMAAGNHKLKKIASVMEMPQTSLTKYLKVLSELDIIEREVPITEENPEKSKKGLYYIKDNFIRFWFRFIYPYRGMLEAGQEEYVIEKIKSAFIENHVSYIYMKIYVGRKYGL